MGSGKKKEAFTQTQSRAGELRSQIEGDRTLTEETRSSLLGQIGGFESTFDATFNADKDQKLGGDEAKRAGNQLEEIAATLEKAQTGQGIFGSRQRRRDFILARADRPGLSKQTR